jgi:predicted glutamine amidotransferase
MCRLFGLTAAPTRVGATFWLIDAPDSLVAQSHREPDGVGLGVFELDGSFVIHKQPVAAYEDMEYAKEARELTGSTFVAHIRYASTGELRLENTHPFLQDDRLFAHNGVVEDLPRLRERVGEALGSDMSDLVRGQTDSELVFALITALARRDGDVTHAIVEAVRWVGQNLPIFALNIILTTPTDMWALRYPETHGLYVLARPAGGPHGGRHLEHASAAGTVRVRSGDLSGAPAIVVASERMDENPAWRMMDPGELIHVSSCEVMTSHKPFTPPVHQLTLDDLHPDAAASQRAAVPA